MQDEQAIKEAFARRVRRLMYAKGYNQSDLARSAGLERNRISTYVNAKSLPNGLFLKKLADALGVEQSELLPEHALSPVKPPYSMIVSADGKSAKISVDVWVPIAVASQIIALLGEYAAVNRA